MSKDQKIAAIHDNQVLPLISELLPIYFYTNDNIIGWLESRTIDNSRPNAKRLKQFLKLSGLSDSEIAMQVNGAVITDTYWVCLEDDHLSYDDDIRFHDYRLGELALLGDSSYLKKDIRDDKFNIRTPELTNIGSFEKCWQRENGKWWLYKQGTDYEQFSELFICKFGKLMGFRMAEYELCERWEHKWIRSQDFTNATGINYESARSLVRDEEDYLFNYKKIYQLNPSMAKEYLDILFMDTICLNMDRHTENYGFMRNSETGEFIGMAPNYDNNIALISRGYPANVKRTNDLLINLFISLIKTLKFDYVFPRITESMIKKVLSEIPLKVDEHYITEFILNGFRRITF